MLEAGPLWMVLASAVAIDMAVTAAIAKSAKRVLLHCRTPCL